jgi:hypothetical protein
LTTHENERGDAGNACENSAWNHTLVSLW